MPLPILPLILAPLAAAAGAYLGGKGNEQEADAKQREADAKRRFEKGKILHEDLSKNDYSPEEASAIGNMIGKTGFMEPGEVAPLVKGSSERHATQQAFQQILRGFLGGGGGTQAQQPQQPNAQPQAAPQAPIAQPPVGGFQGQPGAIPYNDPEARTAFRGPLPGEEAAVRTSPQPTQPAQPPQPTTQAQMTPTRPMPTPATPLSFKPTLHFNEKGKGSLSLESRLPSVEAENTANALAAAKQNNQPAMSALTIATAAGVPINREEVYKQADAEFNNAYTSAITEASRATGGQLSPSDERTAILRAAQVTNYLPKHYADKVFQSPTEAAAFKEGQVNRDLQQHLSLLGRGGQVRQLQPGYFQTLLDESDKNLFPNMPFTPQQRTAILSQLGAGIFSQVQASLAGQYGADAANYMAAEAASRLTGGNIPTPIAQILNQTFPGSETLKNIANLQGIDLHSADKAKVAELQRQANVRDTFNQATGRLDPKVVLENVQQGKTPDATPIQHSAEALIQGEKNRSTELQTREVEKQGRLERQKRTLESLPPQKDIDAIGNFSNALRDVVGWVNKFEHEGEEIPTGYISSIWQAVKEQAPLPGMFKSDPNAVKLFSALQIMRDIRARQMAGLSQTQVEVDNLEKELATGKLQPEALIARLETVRNTAVRELGNVIDTADELEMGHAIPKYIRELHKNPQDFKFIHERRGAKKGK